jgi:hypothetical protein
MRSAHRLATVLLSTALLAACGGSSEPAHVPVTSLLGVIAGTGGLTGTMAFDIPVDNALTALPSSFSVVSVTGTWTQAGVAVPLTGTYDPLTKQLLLSGVRGGVTYSLGSGAQEQTAIDLIGGGGGGSSNFTIAAFVRRPGVTITTQCGDGVGGSLQKVGLVFTSDQRAAMVLHANTIPQDFRPTLVGRQLSEDINMVLTGTIDSSGASANGTFEQVGNSATWTSSTTGC